MLFFLCVPCVLCGKKGFNRKVRKGRKEMLDEMRIYEFLVKT